MRNKRIISFVFIFSCGFLVFWLLIGRSYQHQDLPDILNDGRLTVLIESGEHGFSRDSAKVYGFQYEIIRKYANQLGVELLVINHHGYTHGDKELKNGRCDVLVSLRPLLTDTLDRIVSLNPILSTRLMLVQKVDSLGNNPIRYQFELKNRTLHVMNDSPYLQRLNELSEEVAAPMHVVEVKVASLDEMVQKVNNGEIEFTISPEYLAYKFESRYPGINIRLPLSFRENLSWMVHKNHPLLAESLNQFIDSFILTKEFDDLYRRYFIAN